MRATSRLTRHAIASVLRAVALAALLSAAGTVHAQETLGEWEETTAAPETPPTPPLLDRGVTSALQQFNQWKSRMKSEHFTSYLLAYSALTGTFIGALLAALAFRFGDPMAIYRRLRNINLGLALALGAGLGVILAVFEVPHSRPDRITLLLLAVVCASSAAFLGAALGFYAQRHMRILRAKGAGVAVTDRLVLR
jgi:hypothetical protein